MENQANNTNLPLRVINNGASVERDDEVMNNVLAQAQLQAHIQTEQQTHPILLAHDWNHPIRDYASPILYDFSPRIMRPEF